jgi:beta-mannosidase
VPSRVRKLHDDWTLRDAGGAEYPATVPGCVHTDLLAAGVIPDPHLGANEAATQWIGWADWQYRTTFPATPAQPGERVDLVFHGLDTVTAVTCNDVELGRTENMHRSYRFEVTELIRDGGNELVVDFTSAERFAAERTEQTGGDWPNPFQRPYPVIRKMASNFGWDWGPDLVTAGIWRPVELHTWHTARLASVRPAVRRDGSGKWTVEVVVDLEYAGEPAEVTVTAEVAGVSASARTDARTVSLPLEVVDPRLWWPAGHGEQPLYDLTVRLSTGDDWTGRIGFRTVEIGAPFGLVVNGRPVFARGVNWIPDDTFVTRTGPAEYRDRLRQALDANVNFVRVWGGGLYESDAFYDVCDELGLLVWQDFLFACAAYPEDDRLAHEVEAEAREAIVRLMPHPSLAVWNGNNENIWAWFDWDWRPALHGREWGLSYYLDLLPRLVAELDPSRPYWAGSPYSGSMDLHPNDDRYGVSHVWDVWNDKDYLAYRDRTPRFVSEFGYEGPPTWSTWQRGIGDTPGGHQKAADGDAKLERGLADHFGAGRAALSFDDWLFLTQVIQARAVQVGVGHFRSAQPTCTGTVWWQLNDCWPGPSWAVIDGDRRRKPAWYALRDMYAPRLMSIQPGPTLVLVNDTDDAWTGDAEVTRYDFDGTALALSSLAVNCPARGVQSLDLPGEVGRPERELLRATFGGRPADWFFLTDRDLDYPKAEFAAEVRDGVVEVEAVTLLRDLCLFPDRLDPAAETDTMLVTLLPGEKARFTVRAERPLAAAELICAPVLRCVNDLA